MQTKIRSQSELAEAAPDLAGLMVGLVPGFDPWRLQPDDGWFDAASARFAIDWIEKWCRHVKGAKAGQPFLLEPFQKAIVAMVWGFRQADGRRRFRRIFLYVGKKNGKSAFVAALLLLVMCTDGEQGAELYSVAAAQKQAGLVFDHAAGMVRLEPRLKKRLRVLGDKGGTVSKSITDYSSMSAYKCLASDADSADGVNPHMSVVDELHRHPNGELMDVLERSAATRAQPMTWVTTTADYHRPSPCNELRKLALQVRANDGDPSKPGFMPEFLPAVWEASIEDDWSDEATWRKANPGLGTIKPLDAMRAAYREAMDAPSKLNSFLRLDLNIVTDSDQAWLDPKQWEACGGLADGESSVAWRERMLAELAGEPCVGAIDLARSKDMTAFALWFPAKRVVLLWYWIPRETAHAAERRDHVPYEQWARDGWLEMTEGNVADYDHVEKRLLQIAGTFAGLRLIAYDDWYAAQLVQRLQTARLEFVNFPQGFKSMTKPAYELERLVAAGGFTHGGNPVLTWNAGNAMIERDPANNIKPSKRRSTGRIDGLVCLVMTLGVAGSAVAQSDTLEEILMEPPMEIEL